jgi:hypothetical protein
VGEATEITGRNVSFKPAGGDQIAMIEDQPPDPAQEAITAVNALIVPFQMLLRRGGKEGEETGGICPVLGNQFVRIDDILLRLAHLFGAPGQSSGPTL